jgi:hypothetical protein
MTAMSDYLENALADHVLRNQSWTLPANIYVGLFKASPNDDFSGSAQEVSGGNYARGTATFAAASGGTVSTSAAITFNQATADWGTITHIGLLNGTAFPGGTLLFHGSLTSSVIVNNGGIFEIPAGSLSVGLQ